MEKTTGRIKTCKKGGTSIFIVNKRLKEAKLRFLIKHGIKHKGIQIVHYFIVH